MQTMRYNLKDISDITFNGFEIKLPDETLSIITELAMQVGSPTYIRTPTFYKKEQNNKHNGSVDDNGFKRKKRSNRSSNDCVNDDDWESIRSFQATKIEQKVGINAQIDMLRSALNKMTDKNYNDSYVKIIDILDQLIEDETSAEDMLKISNSIFDIASTNRFYSKLYADKDYDKFCKVVKDNERRKALSAFFVNLTKNKIISDDKLMGLTKCLLEQLTSFILIENKKSEVDELTENIAILYSKSLFEICVDKIGDETFMKIINRLAHSKVKTYPSLSNKSIFKFMDLIEM